MNKNLTTLTLYPSKRKTIVFLLVSLLFVLAGMWLIGRGESEMWFPLIFFGICSLVFTIILLPNSSYLCISEKGFETRSLYRSIFTNWNEVGRFESKYIGPTKMVTFNYSPEHDKYEIGRKISQNTAGVDRALPDTYGKSTEELTKLLNEWKEKFSKK